MDTPAPGTILDKLGQELLSAFCGCVYAAQDDFKELVEFKPDWAASYTQRFKANFLHERLWQRFTAYAEDAKNVSIKDEEPYRNISVGTGIQLRIKRHSKRDLIATYPTSEAKGFYGAGGQFVIDGLERIGLAIGYRWDSEVDEVIAPVLSLQDLEGKKLLWSVELVQDADQQDTKITYREIEEPEAPQIAFGEGLFSLEEIKKEGKGER